SASGGRITGSGDTVTFDATGVAPGEYTITGSVADDHGHAVTCSSRITVIKKNLAPTVTVEPTSASLTVGESVTIRAVASDPNNDPLTYSWKAGTETLAATGANVTFGSVGRQPGNYPVTVTVSDGELTASATSNITVRARPNVPPTIQCLTTTLDVATGGSVQLDARTADPDGDKVTVGWTATGGSVSGSGETATFSATGLRAGSYTVTATADDGRGGRASCTMTVNVSERINLMSGTAGGFAPGRDRLDNVAKAALDDIAVRMQNDPRLHANIIGYTDTSRTDTRVRDLGLKRAQAAAKYLEGKGISPTRMTTTDGGASNPIGDNKTADGRRLNRRVEIELTVR
ncbi:MAG: PKD domain-containing protein, partial [Acidobacteriota bacterium]